MKQLQNICILEKSDFNKKYLSDHYITLVLIGRDGGLSSVYHSCKFVALLIIYIYIYMYIYIYIYIYMRVQRSMCTRLNIYVYSSAGGVQKIDPDTDIFL